jgi:hypothetical protein
MARNSAAAAAAAKAENDMVQVDNNNESGTAGAIFEDGGSLLIDLGGVEEAKFELLPAGWYQAEVDAWEFGPSKNGAPQFVATYRLLDPDRSKVKLKKWYTFTEKSLPFVKAELCRFARDIFGGQFNPQEVADSGTLIGREVRIRVAIGEYEGEKRNNIANVAPPAGEANEGAKQGGRFF